MCKTPAVQFIPNLPQASKHQITNGAALFPWWWNRYSAWIECRFLQVFGQFSARKQPTSLYQMGECVVASLKMMGVFRHFWSNDRVETPAECGEMGEALNCWLSTMTCRYHSQASPKPAPPCCFLGCFQTFLVKWPCRDSCRMWRNGWGIELYQHTHV